MRKQKTKYIVKRNYNNLRTDTDAFISLIKKANRINNINKIELNQYNIDNDKKECYNKNSFRESCVISESSNKGE